MPRVERISSKVGYQAPMIGTKVPGNEGKWGDGLWVTKLALEWDNWEC